jgi:uncharacterized protein (DUF885 family)
MRMLAVAFFSLVTATLILPMITLSQTPSDPPAQSKAAQEFRAYLDSDWKRWMELYPELATAVGYPGQNRRWIDDSPQGIEARKAHLAESYKRIKAIDRNSLPPSEQIDYDLYRELLETATEGLQYGDDPMPFRNVVPANLWMPLTQMGGPQQGAADTLASMPRQSIADYEDILARMEALPRNVAEQLALLKDGLRRGFSPPKVTMRDVSKQIADLVPQDPIESALLEPFTAFPSNIPAGHRVRLTNRAKEIYSSSLRPAFQRLHDYLANTYVPACRDSIAVTSLPNGAASYGFHVRWQTTTELTPQQIHEIGLSEVKRIRGEMDKVIASTGFNGTFHQFTDFLRNDSRFYFDKPQDLIDAYKIIAKTIDPELVHEFGKLPRNQYGVIPIPDFKAPSQTTAYYQPGAPAAGRPGFYFVNTYNLHARPKWEMEALSLHEAVPGHHLQLSLAQELERVPEFRKHVGYSAFVEGWALYSETLGGELGLYKDSYSKFGQLSYEMWRAVRLVVDTGMHTMGWTREQAIQFFKDNTGKTDQDITVEVDRYIVWPGQALAYKIGQLRIRELRNAAEKQLGDKFNVRTFHDALLENGAVPLSVLEPHIKEWLERQASRGPVGLLSGSK